MKKIFFTILFLYSSLFAQFTELGKAKGFFFDVGIGPRIPVSEFSNSSNLGIGGDFTFSYTDNKYLPVFFYGRIGYQHYPGRQDLYKKTDYASFSNNVILLNLGARYYFSPIIENVVILMPVVEGGISFGYFEKAHIYKSGTGHQNFVEENVKTGFHLGAGFSMFLMDVLVTYNYFHNNQYLALDLKVRIPVYAIF